MIGTVLVLIGLIIVGIALIAVAAMVLGRSAQAMARYPDPEPGGEGGPREARPGARSGTVSAPVPASFGPEALTQAVRRYMGPFEEHGYEVERLTYLASGAVLAVVTEKGPGESSGVPERHSFAALCTVIDGEVARITVFPSEELALEAAGLSE